MEHITAEGIGVTLCFVVLIFIHFRQRFKIEYYEKVLEIHGIEDKVKYMAFWKIWVD